MSAAAADRMRTKTVELTMDAQVLLARQDEIDTREDDLVRRAHVALHRLEQIDKEEDAARVELRDTFRELAGLLDGADQMRFREIA